MESKETTIGYTKIKKKKLVKFNQVKSFRKNDILYTPSLEAILTTQGVMASCLKSPTPA